MVKEVSKSTDNSFGIASVILGIFSILFASVYGIVLGVIALVFANKQQSRHPTAWGKKGKILAIIGILLSVLFIIITIFYYKNFNLIPNTTLPQ